MPSPTFGKMCGRKKKIEPIEDFLFKFVGTGKKSYLLDALTALQGLHQDLPPDRERPRPSISSTTVREGRTYRGGTGKRKPVERKPVDE